MRSNRGGEGKKRDELKCDDKNEEEEEEENKVWWILELLKMIDNNFQREYCISEILEDNIKINGKWKVWLNERYACYCNFYWYISEF